MERPSRRSVLEVLGGLALGGAAVSDRPHWPGFFGGYVEATPIDPLLEDGAEARSLPDEFVTPRDDESIADLEPLQTALRRDDERVEVSRREFGEVYDALAELPVFNPYRHDGYEHSGIASGHYVRDSTATHRVRLVPWCSDSWWIETSGSPTNGAACSRR